MGAHDCAVAKQPAGQIQPMGQHLACETTLFAPGQPCCGLLELPRPAGQVDKHIDTGNIADCAISKLLFNVRAA